MFSSSNLALGAFLAACFVAAMSGGLFRPGEWYEGLAKPWWRPPKWLFAPAWAVLYFTIAIAGWMVWRRTGFAPPQRGNWPLGVWSISLCFNAAWSAIFFGLRRMDLAFLEVVMLWLSIAATIAAFYPVAPRAAWLLVPYLCWVTFASALNFTIWRMNR